MECNNLHERCMHTRKDCLVYNNRWVQIIFCFFNILIIFFFIVVLLYVPDISLLSSSTLCQTYKAWTLVFLFNFFFSFSFSLFGFRVSVRVISWLHCHTSVTSDDMVTVTVTSHKVSEKDIEDSGKIILYNICKPKKNIWLFRVD